MGILLTVNCQYNQSDLHFNDTCTHVHLHVFIHCGDFWNVLQLAEGGRFWELLQLHVRVPEHDENLQAKIFLVINFKNLNNEY